MSDYIERQAAIEAVRQAVIRGYDTDYGAIDSDVVYEVLDNLSPATDVAPVVRCDDCKYRGSRRWCELHSSVFDDDAFCSYGEKSDG